ncbi:MAG: hypothetical protein JO080_04545 [Mucilaginibacter sp.]|nr:hypothetical protein [Mucilaginibacter sp.]
MRSLLISVSLAFIAFAGYAQDETVRISQVNSAIPTQQGDSVKLKIDGTSAYYQKTVKVDTGIGVSLIYLRALQFMAAKNFQQTYGFEQEGKQIFTTTQDLNTNPFTIGNYLDNIDPFTVQFAITIDMKKQRYRYTIHNVIFYRPTDTGNQRMTLYEMYLRETNGDSRSIKKDARKVVDAFEKYISSLTAELRESINHKAMIYDTKF